MSIIETVTFWSSPPVTSESSFSFSSYTFKDIPFTPDWCVSFRMSKGSLKLFAFQTATVPSVLPVARKVVVVFADEQFAIVTVDTESTGLSFKHVAYTFSNLRDTSSSSIMAISPSLPLVAHRTTSHPSSLLCTNADISITRLSAVFFGSMNPTPFDQVLPCA